MEVFSFETIFLLFFWSVFLFFLGHSLVKSVVSIKNISAHRGCLFLSLFSFCALFALCALIPSNFFFAQLLFVSLLIAISIGDFCTLFIPTLLTIGFIPVAFMSAWYNYLPITITQSIVGAIFGYTILWLFSYVYTKRTGIQGIGEGDFDMLALIGAFTGFYGSWAALTIGSAVGSCLGILYYFKKKTLHTSPFPFGPLLAFGAYCYVVYMFIVYP